MANRLTTVSEYTLYNLIRERFDSLGTSLSEEEEVKNLIDLARELELFSLAEQMENDAFIGKHNIPQPPLPTGCVTRQEWLKTVAGGKA